MPSFSLVSNPMSIFLMLVLLIFCLPFILDEYRYRGLPGPKPRFWSGNLHQLSESKLWLLFTEWHRLHGPIVFYRIFNHKTVVLNSLQAAFDLLDSRSAIYSDRPFRYSFCELAGRKSTVAQISSRNPRFKKYRTLLHSAIDPSAVRDAQEDETHKLLQHLSKSPNEFIAHLRRFAGGVVLKVAYGWTVSANDDYFVAVMKETFELYTEFSSPGSWLIDVFPMLRFIPSWFPYSPFDRRMAQVRQAFARADAIPHSWAKQQIESGEYVESFTSRHLLPDNGTAPSADDEDIIMRCSSALYTGGADTVAATLGAFILLMVLNPQSKHRAQAEIDALTGGERLLRIKDQSRLPYLSALILETLRWAPPAPLGIPHSLTENDEYEGYSISKGTTVIANIWSFSRDSATYPEPDAFHPERYLPSELIPPQLDPRTFVFGFGRRTCPGSDFAIASIFLAASNILAVFDISKPLDIQGRELEPSVEFINGTTSHVKPFACRITPRMPGLLESSV